MKKKEVVSEVTKPVMTIAKFNKLSVVKQRVAIAEDIIDAIKNKKYIASKGKYLGDVTINGNETLGKYHQGDIQETLPVVTKCHVCALGSCIMSITKFKNKLKWKDVGRTANEIGNNVTDLLATVFTPLQISIIEVMFEGSYEKGLNNLGRDNMKAEELSDDLIEKCIRFKNVYKSDNNRLIAIMQHIIDQKGKIVL